MIIISGLICRDANVSERLRSLKAETVFPTANTVEKGAR